MEQLQSLVDTMPYGNAIGPYLLYARTHAPRTNVVIFIMLLLMAWQGATRKRVWLFSLSLFPLIHGSTYMIRDT